jgi:hypothetical protein
VCGFVFVGGRGRGGRGREEGRKDCTHEKEKKKRDKSASEGKIGLECDFFSSLYIFL